MPRRGALSVEVAGSEFEKSVGECFFGEPSERDAFAHERDGGIAKFVDDSDFDEHGELLPLSGFAELAHRGLQAC
jgi:hypothetical protein